ncbi:aminotransferase class V-fold PLP-dependent enzyme [Adhaeretor mobilis]|uniref:cysteine desulfurase n=1 Tax=Adhaeretor mobilis TaxID=1930276 RepID=A0A517MWL8_9BACT|nr:aminotransferase class V-fold PLP-dependent enzyme [Adhaeretor mobilis]QDS99271.1 Cysteine desulfurase [Adhaeretor mobilis]
MVDRQEIYLDDNATTRVLPLAAKEAYAVMEDLYGNPSSSHISGLQARQILESAREVARDVLGASQGRIVFTSGATEAIQTGIFSALCQAKQKLAAAESNLNRGLLLYGATEHKAVPQALLHWNELLDLHCHVLAVPVDCHGQLDMDFLRDHINNAHLLCTMSVNNETGIVHDLKAIEAAVIEAKHHVCWLVDCVQAVGKRELNLSDSVIDYATISGHKLYAPKGIGILYVREGSPFTPLLAGGGQERGARGGTENLPGVAAIASVLRAFRDKDVGVFSSPATLEKYRDRIRGSLEKAFPEIQYNAACEETVPTTINFSVPGVAGKELLDLFDAAGIRVSSGSACGSAVQGSYVLEAMGLPAWRSDGAIRLSFGPATQAADVEAACSRIAEAGTALAKACIIRNGDLHVNSDQVSEGLLQLKNGSMCSWIFSDATTRKCIIVDPFEELLDRIETIVHCQELQVVAVLDTHQHVDHDSPREQLVSRLGSRMLDQHASTDILGWPSEPNGQVVLSDESDAAAIHLSKTKVIARTPLPGHTVDGQAYLVGKPVDGRLESDQVRFAFTGDTLLIGGIGRTDFATSAAESLLDSLRNLPRVIADNSIICPTHDYNMGFVTTLCSERQHNQLLAQILDPVSLLSVEDYLATKKEVDSEITDETNCELVCGRIENYPADQAASSIDVDSSQLSEFFRQHQDSLIVDVREAHEFAFAQNWTSLGLDSPPKNVPLTRLGDFLAKFLASSNPQKQEVIFICRSGNRSSKAAQVARRLGLSGAWQIAGGIALGISPSREVVEAEEMEYAI